MPMLNAISEDKERIIEILLLAFEQNQSVNYICGKDELHYLRMRLLMEYSYKVCNSYGKIFISEDKNSCAMVLLPDKKRKTIKSLIWDINLTLRVIGLRNIFKVMEREIQIKRHHPIIPYYYLWFIGVHPKNVGTGIGSTLLMEVIADAAQMDRPIYLETSMWRNLAWYEQFGFKIYKELNFGYKLFLLSNNTLFDD